MVLTAWKRVYYEMDTMYRRGSLLRHPATARLLWVDVQDVAPFVAATAGGGVVQVRVFDEVNREPALIRIDRVEPLGPAPAGRVHLSSPLTQPYGIRNRRGAFVGIETGVAAADFFIPDTSALPQTFDDTYVEWRELSQRRSPRVPLLSAPDDPALLEFAWTWFDNRASADAHRNVVYLVGAKFYAGDGVGATWGAYRPVTPANRPPQRNISFAFNEWPMGTPLPALSARSTVHHELIHQFDPGGDDAGYHDTERAWDNSDQCLMDGAGRNRLDGMDELCREHLYQVRDKEDGL
ncbi:MAG: hypothetical protein NTW87_24855 [Planctomycetota bacterium]|nr:hypothetical protein [Planctomycetota bacterium]